MKNQVTGGLAAMVLALAASAALAQGTPAPAAKDAGAATRKQNLDQEIRMLRKDIRADKAKIIGAAMQLDADQSAKFWPIYKEYEGQLTKLNDLREANIREYAKNYGNISDNKADELVNAVFAYHKKRLDLLANTYDKVRTALGSPVAARFVQAESALQNIIDLQIQTSLPLIWGSSETSAK
jgi:hypothetical protein